MPPSFVVLLVRRIFLYHPGAGLSADERQLTALIGLSPSPGTPRTAPQPATEVSLSPLSVMAVSGELLLTFPNEHNPVGSGRLREVACLLIPSLFGDSGNVSAKGCIQFYEGFIRLIFLYPSLGRQRKRLFGKAFSERSSFFYMISYSGKPVCNCLS